MVNVKSKWPHLKDINIPEATSCDVTDIILPIETRCGPRGAPVSIRTKLGWTIPGAYLQDSDGIFHTYIQSADEELNNMV